MNRLLRLFAILFIGIAAIYTFNQDGFNTQKKEIIIRDAYLQIPAPGQTTAAGYFTLTNNSKETLKLSHVETNIASGIEIHTHVMENGMMAMRPIDVEVKPGESVTFEPGKLHLMLFDVRTPLSEKKYLFTLWFENGKSIAVPFAVREEQAP